MRVYHLSQIRKAKIAVMHFRWLGSYSPTLVGHFGDESKSSQPLTAL